MIKTTGIRAGLYGGLFVLASANALAAEIGGDEMSLEEVTVTAERVTKDLQKTPQFISVKSGAELKSEGKVSVENIMTGVAGFTVEPTGNGQDTQIYIRGISNATAGVSIVVDGISQAVGTQSRASTFRATSLDVSQVAITRGVQNGAGVTALSGTVQLVTNKPVFENQILGSVTVGSFKTQNTEGVLNLPLSSNQAIRMAFNTERRDAYASSGQGEVDNRAFRFRYRWQASDALELNASYYENKVSGASNAASSSLFTGYWQTLPGGGVLAYNNPYSGATTLWGQQIAGKQFYYTGNVQAGFTAQNSATNTVGVGTLGISSTNSALTTNGQYYYPAPTCLANTAFLPTAPAAGSLGTSAKPFATLADANAALANLGPASQMYGCPFNMVAIRNGVNWYDRTNPWDDGFRPGGFMNTASAVALSRQGSVTLDWALPAGNLQVQPSFIYGKAYIVNVARGTGWTENSQPEQYSYRVDASFTSKKIGDFQYILGLNSNSTPGYDAGTVVGPQSRVVTAAVLPWATSFTTVPSTLGTPAPNGGQVSLMNTNCYAVLPSVSGGVVQATAKGVVNNTLCNGSSYSTSGTGDQRNVAFSANLNYTAFDRLQLSGTVRYEDFKLATRPIPPLFLVDTDGQRYVYVLPNSTTASATTSGNPNSPYVLPYRMNLSAADLDTVLNAYAPLQVGLGATTFTLNAQFDVTPTITTYARLATGTSASMADDSGRRPQTAINLTLPDAKVPLFGGNATAAAIARSGMPYEYTVVLPDRNSRLAKGDITRQITYGLKSRWFDNRLQLNVEGFYNRYDNKSLTFITGAFPTDVYSQQLNPTASQACTNTAPTSGTPFVIALDSAGTVANRGLSCFNVFQPVGGPLGTGAPWTGTLLTRGADVDVTWTPTASDRLDVTTELLNTAYLGSPNLPTVTVDSLRPYVISGSNDALLAYYAQIFNDFTPGVRGHQLANAPKMTLNATYQHRFRLQNAWTITPRIQMNYTSAKFISSGGAGVPSTDSNNILDSNWAIDNGRRLPAVVPTNRIYNVFVQLMAPSGKWYVNGYVNNLKNTAVMGAAFGLTTYSVGSRATNDLQQIVTSGNLQIGAPRVVGLTIGAQL